MSQLIIHNQFGEEIRSVDDWFRLAPPKRGAVHWKDFLSAKELARCWFRTGTAALPSELGRLLAPVFGQEVRLTEAIPECIIRLDELRGEHRNCDLVAHGHGRLGRILLNIEAKADEPFGDSTVGQYHDHKLTTPSRVPLRIVNLADRVFGRFDFAIRALQYQLLHSVAAALIAAADCKAEVAIFIVHVFRSSRLDEAKVNQNMTDWGAFVRAFPELTKTCVEEDQVLGPVYTNGTRNTPLYLGHLVTDL
jgi:hypothetical protein